MRLYEQVLRLVLSEICITGAVTVVHGGLAPSVPGHLTHNCDLAHSQTLSIHPKYTGEAFQNLELGQRSDVPMRSWSTKWGHKSLVLNWLSKRKHDIHSCMSRWWWKCCWKPRIWVKPTLKKALDRITLLRHEIVCASPEIGPFRNTFKLAGVVTVVQGFLVPSVPGHLTHNCDLTDSQTP
jgi:hypothetical protein